MDSNFLLGLQAVRNDIFLTFTALIESNALAGFVLGMLVAILVIGLVVSKDPRRIPLILKYSAADSFQKISNQNGVGTYQLSYSKFMKSYSATRIFFSLFIFIFIVFIVWSLAHFVFPV